MMTLCPLRRRRCWRAAAIEKAEASNESGSSTSASSTQTMVEAAVKAASGAETLWWRSSIGPQSTDTRDRTEIRCRRPRSFELERNRSGFHKFVFDPARESALLLNVSRYQYQ
jgi:hypothetical protein